MEWEWESRMQQKSYFNVIDALFSPVRVPYFGLNWPKRLHICRDGEGMSEAAEDHKEKAEE